MIESARRAARAWRVIALVYALRVVASLWGTAPLVDVFAQGLAGRRSDVELFRNGSVLLIDALLRRMGAIGHAASVELWTVLALAILSVFPLAALIDAIAFPARSRAERARASFAGGVRFAALLGPATVVEAGMIALGAVLAARVDVTSWSKLALAAALFAVGLVAQQIVGAFHDLARVASLTQQSGVVGSIRRAARTLRSAPWRTLGWALATSITTTVLLTIGLLVPLATGVRSTATWLVVGAVQQALILGALFLRAMVLARFVALDEALDRRFRAGGEASRPRVESGVNHKAIA